MQVRPLAVAAALLPVGACAAMDPGAWSPFGPSKWLAVSVLGLVVVALACTGSRLRIARWPTVAWGVLVGLMAVAAIGGLDPLYAWTGTPERHLGVFGWLLIGAMFVAGQQLRATDRATVATGLIAAGWFVAVYSVVEVVWRAPIRLATTSDRLGGPFGSPAFLGAACALLVPALTGAALDRRLPRWLRVTASPAAVGCTVALVGSAARAAWLATGLAASVVAALRWRTAPQRLGAATASVGAPDGHPPSSPARDALTEHSARGGRWPGRRALTTGAVVVIGAGVLCAALLGGRLGSALERSYGAGSRLDEWRVAARVIADHPVLGTGPEGYRIAVPGNVDADYERTYGREVMPDRAHSGILDVTATGGLLAGLAYAALLALLARTLVRAVRRGEALLVGLAAGIGAYLLQQQLLFPLAELDPVVWLLAGAVVAWSPLTAAAAPGNGDAPYDAELAPAPTPQRPAPRWQLALGAVAGVLAIVSAIAGVLDVAADRLDKRALGALADDRTTDAVDLARRATDLRPDVVRYRLVLGRAEQSAATLSGVDRWLATVDDALDVSPGDPIVRQERGLALNRRAAITGTDADTAAALAYWQRLVADDGHNARWQLELGRAAAAAGDVPGARAAWTAAADLAPDDPRAPALLAALPP